MNLKIIFILIFILILFPLFVYALNFYFRKASKENGNITYTYQNKEQFQENENDKGEKEKKVEEGEEGEGKNELSDYEERMKTKRSNYLSDLQDEENIVDDIDESDDEEDDEMYIYNLQNMRSMKTSEKILVISKDDYLFDNNILQNMKKTESLLRKVSRMFDNAKKSKEIVQNELEKPVDSLQLQINNLLDVFGDDENDENDQNNDISKKVQKIEISDVSQIKEFKKDYMDWMILAQNSLDKISKENDKTINIKTLQDIINSFENHKNNDNNIEPFIPDRSNNKLNDDIKKDEEKNDIVLSIKEFKDQIYETMQNNSDTMSFIDRFLLIWQEYVEKVQFVKNGIDESLNTLNNVKTIFWETYYDFIDFLPIIERYFTKDIDEIIQNYKDEYPNIEKIKLNNIPMTNFQYIHDLPDEKKIFTEPLQIENVKKYTHRAIRNTINLIDKDSSKIREKVLNVKVAFVDGTNVPFNSMIQQNRRFRSSYFIFRKSYFDQVTDIKEIIDKIEYSTIKYERDLEKIYNILQKHDNYVNFDEKVNDVQQQILKLYEDFKSEISNSKYNKNEESEENWSNYKNTLNNVKEKVKEFLDIQKNMKDTKSKIQNIFDELQIDFEIKTELEKVKKELNRIQEIYLELPDEFNNYENQFDIYETNALKVYDASAFIYTSIESLLHPMIEDILELKHIKTNKLYKDFFAQAKQYFEQ